VLTLLYNHVMDFPMCRRYVPIWQRVFNHFLLASSPLTCPLEHYRNTYMWLNNHILQSGLVWTICMWEILTKQGEGKKHQVLVFFFLK
jgi:hypothetical protein